MKTCFKIHFYFLLLSILVFSACGDSNNSNKSWTHPRDLTDYISPDGWPAHDPQVAMDDNGNALIIWGQYDDGSQAIRIYKSEYRNGTWTHPSGPADYINPDGNSYGVGRPQVAMDDNGNAIITWYQFNNGNSRVYKSEYRNGEWTYPRGPADNILEGWLAKEPQVAMDDNGNAIIAWELYDGSDVQIYMSEYRNEEWTHPRDLSDNISPDGQDAYYPKVAMDDNGNAIIAWHQYDGSDSVRIYKSEYRNGEWTHPSDLTDYISLDELSAIVPQVAMDDNGNAIITWMQEVGSSRQIYMSEYRNGAWTHPSGLSDNISPDGQDAQGHQVAMDDNGNAIIVWNQYEGRGFWIFKSEYRNSAWTHPSDLSDFISSDGQEAYAPQVAMDDNGNAIIAWYQFDGSNWQIYKSEYRNGAWTHPSGLTDNISPDGQDAEGPQVAMDNNGSAIITWCQSDGSNLQIFKSEYR